MTLALWLLWTHLSAAGELRLEEVLARVAEQPGVEASAADVRAAEAGVQAARAIDNPQLRMGVDQLARRLETPAAALAVRIPIPRPWDEVGELRVARAELAAAEGLGLLVRDEAARAAAGRFVDAYEADRVAQAHAAAAEAWRGVLTQTEARRAEGLADAVDVARARTDVARAEADARLARAEADGARAALLALQGLRDAPPLADPGEAPLPPTAAQAGDAAISRVTRWREAVEDGAAASHAALRLAEVPWFDWLEVRPTGADALELRVALRVPLWAWGTAPAHEAAAELEAERARTEEVLLALRADAEAAWHAVAGARGAWEALRAAADETLAAGAGASPFLAPAVAAEAADLAARAAEARRAWQVAAWELAATVGLLTPSQ